MEWLSLMLTKGDIMPFVPNTVFIFSLVLLRVVSYHWKSICVHICRFYVSYLTPHVFICIILYVCTRTCCRSQDGCWMSSSIAFHLFFETGFLLNLYVTSLIMLVGSLPRTGSSATTFICVLVYMHVFTFPFLCHDTPVESEDSLQESFLFHCMCPGVPSKIIWFNGKQLYLLSHLTSPPPFFFFWDIVSFTMM